MLGIWASVSRAILLSYCSTALTLPEENATKVLPALDKPGRRLSSGCWSDLRSYLQVTHHLLRAAHDKLPA